jgi:glucose/arabinose dehydrogenase
VAAALTLGLSAGAAEPDPAAPRIQLRLVAGGLSFPTYVTHPRDRSNRLFILEQPGRIKVLRPGATTPSVFLDIRPKVLAGGERGLLGLAFHPRFAQNRRFFVNYTRRPDGATIIAQYRASATNPNVADPAELRILAVAQPFVNHNGGMIEFGPDGFLYIAFGDGGAGNDPGNRAQNLETLLGKLLRIDVDRPTSPTKPYSSPPGNPFFGSIPGRDEIWALGLRNPWRFSFDRKTGDLWLGDVGQGDWEEIDFRSRAQLPRLWNYGWNAYEGFARFGRNALTRRAPLVFPVVVYSHEAGCSVTGGYVYRGSLVPALRGRYLYGDYCSGRIWSLVRVNGKPRARLEPGRIAGLSSFGEDARGELYATSLNGTLYQLVR